RRRYDRARPRQYARSSGSAQGTMRRHPTRTGHLAPQVSFGLHDQPWQADRSLEPGDAKSACLAVSRYRSRSVKSMLHCPLHQFLKTWIRAQDRIVTVAVEVNTMEVILISDPQPFDCVLFVASPGIPEGDPFRFLDLSLRIQLLQLFGRV